MKVLLKKTVPVVVAVLGITGAFVTTSMQNTSKKSASARIGYIVNAQGKCTDVSVICSDLPSPFLCRLGITSGPIAYDKDAQNNCVQPLYRAE